MPKNDGKYFEKIVELLEQSIDPDATIKHDVNMPILTSKEGHTMPFGMPFGTDLFFVNLY